MTTIAYRLGVLASDSRLTDGDKVATDKCKKIWRLPDGSLFGASGENEPGLLLLRALQNGRSIPDLGDVQMNAIRVMPNGRIYVSEGKVWDRWPERYIAIGSGALYARAAMLNGANAAQAVKTGIKCDAHSGGRVQRVTFA